MERTSIQLERVHHRLAAGGLALLFAALAVGTVAAGASFVLAIQLQGNGGALFCFGTSLFFAAGFAWTALMGMRDVVVGYRIDVVRGVLSFPHRLWRRSVPLAELQDVRRSPDLELVRRDGEVIRLRGTGVLRGADLDAAVSTLRALLAPELS